MRILAKHGSQAMGRMDETTEKHMQKPETCILRKTEWEKKHCLTISITVTRSTTMGNFKSSSTKPSNY